MSSVPAGRKRPRGGISASTSSSRAAAAALSDSNGTQSITSLRRALGGGYVRRASRDVRREAREAQIVGQTT